MRDEALSTVTAVCRAFNEQIGRGLLSTSDKLPAERKLSELPATTRITLREALIQLESQGPIYHKEHRNWLVSSERPAYNPLVYNHSYAVVSEQGQVPATEVLSTRQIPASAAVCELLELPALSSAY